MPKFIETEDDKKINAKQDTTPGLYVTSGEIEHGDYDQKDWHDLLQDYTNMRNGGPVLNSSMNILKLPILQAERDIQKGDNSDIAKQAVDFANWTFDGMHKGFEYYKRHKLLSLDFGCAIHEPVWKADKFDKKQTLRLIKMSPIMLETIYKWLYNEYGEIYGIVQERREPETNSITYPELQLDQLDMFSYNEEFNDPRGRSILRPARLYYESKKKVIISKANGIQRGSGFPIVKASNNVKKATIEKIGRTITGKPGGYLGIDRDNVEVESFQVPDIGDIVPLCDYFDRQMFFNTLSEFLTAGIGSNGSRAATEALKAPYEMAAGYILQILEETLQKTCDRIIYNSYLAGKIKPEQMPVFKFASITQADMMKVAQELNLLVQSGFITPDPKLNDYVKSMFNLPTANIDSKVGHDAEDTENKDDAVAATKLSLSEHRKLEECEFNLEKANDQLLDSKARAEEIIDNVLDRILADAGKQLENGKDFKLKYQEELFLKMNKLYNELYENGIKDVSSELAKLDSKKLQVPEDIKKKISARLERAIERLYKDIDFAITDRVSKLSSRAIEIGGGIGEIVSKMADGFKGDRRRILTEAESGYFDGRGSGLESLAKETELFYSAILDKNLCEVCAPFDGEIRTIAEWESEGMNLTSPTNPNCLGLLGQGSCRCVLIPYRI